MGAIIRKINDFDPKPFDTVSRPLVIDPIGGEVSPQPNWLDLDNMYCWEIARTKNETYLYIQSWEPQQPEARLECAVVKNGQSDPAYFQDFPLHGRETWIRFRRAKFKCKHCGETWQERTDQLDQRHRMTSRFRSYVEEKSVTHSFLEAARICSIDRKRVERVFKSYAERRLQNYAANLPTTATVLSIHVEEIMGRSTLIVGDVKAGRMFDLVQVSSREDVAAYFHSLASKSVKFLSINPLGEYASDMSRFFKEARPLIGRMPLLKVADRIIDKIRIAKNANPSDCDHSALSDFHNTFVGSPGTALFQNEIRFIKSLHARPLLRHAHLLRLQISKLYDLKSQDEAGQALDALVNSARIGGVACDELRRLLTDWRPAILAFFHAGLDVADLGDYDQSVAEIVAGMQRITRGHKFETLRAKLLLRYGEDASIAFNLISVPPELHDEMLEAFYCNGAPLEELRRALKSPAFQL